MPAPLSGDLRERSGCGLKKELEGGRAGSSRCCRTATPLAGLAALHGWEPIRVSRRDRADDQDDPPLWSEPARRAARRVGAARGLSFDHLHRRVSTEGPE